MKKDTAAVTVIVGLLVWATLSILKPVYALEVPEMMELTGLPEIQQCDKPLWERIRYEC
jgi:hypothetical protein